MVVSLAILVDPSRIRRIGQKMIEDEALLFTSGILSLVLGLVLVLAHNYWAWNWQGAITVFGWIAIMAGALRLIFPMPTKMIGTGMIENPILITFSASCMGLLGLFLSYQGYFSG